MSTLMVALSFLVSSLLGVYLGRKALGPDAKSEDKLIGSILGGIVLGALGLVLGVLALGFIGVYTDREWLRSLGFSQVWDVNLGFMIQVFVGVLLSTVAWLVAVDFLGDKLLGKRKTFDWWTVTAGLVLGLVLAIYHTQFTTVDLQRYVASQPFGRSDSVFGLDWSFYVNKLPLLITVQGYAWFMWFVSCAVFLIKFIRADNDSKLRISEEKFATAAFRHMVILFAVAFAMIGVGKIIDRYELVLGLAGAVEMAKITGKTISMYVWFGAAAIIADVAFIFPLINKEIMTPADAVVEGDDRLKIRAVLPYVGTIVLVLVLQFLAGFVYPGLVSRYVVRPQYVRQQTPYAEQWIAETRFAFGLENLITEDEIQVGPLPELAEADAVPEIRAVDYDLVRKDVVTHQTFRVWLCMDDADLDRLGDQQFYMIPRELCSDGVPSSGASDFVLHRLQYLSGYGAVAVAANRSDPSGKPSYMVSQMPAVGEDALIPNEQALYFGMTVKDFAITGTRQNEYVYNSQTSNGYAGADGVKLGSFGREMLYALRENEASILLSADLTHDSRILLYRNIEDRVKNIAPFLRYDTDPYLVAGEDQFYWVLDAYTIAGQLPMVEAFDGVSYVRNPVKVMIGAYSGTVEFYLIDETDPLATMWANLYPNLFLSADEMPTVLVEHIRYPEQMFTWQANTLLIYHETDVQKYLSKENRFELPKEDRGTGDEFELVVPRYKIERLRGEEEAEFVLSIPFSPFAKSNLAGWLYARMDGEHYGELVLYKFPTNSSIYGPEQVEQSISGDTAFNAPMGILEDQKFVQRGALIGTLLWRDGVATPLWVKTFYTESKDSSVNTIPVQSAVAVYTISRVEPNGELIWLVAAAESYEVALELMINGGGVNLDIFNLSGNQTPTSSSGQTASGSDLPPDGTADFYYQEAQACLQQTPPNFVCFDTAFKRLGEALEQ